ncbi:MAG TPA: bifunctional aspartate kinase/diaminopimelate decarboxylase [Steroidobacteraceae bacterium]|nr:bifunctional aspartate kinase/diaminopimelate decarboxylase [Steroidobacteraceae bacterium]
MSLPQQPWIVLKFGGTSVSTAANWANILAIVQARLATGARVLVVHSAVSGITDRLEKLLVAALAGAHEPLLTLIEQRHRQLADELGVGASPELERYFSVLRQMTSGIALMNEVSERTRARLLATGELMATEIGARYLQSRGTPAQWWDARTGLVAEQRTVGSGHANYLSAICEFGADSALQAQLSAIPGVIVTQGFIAGAANGDTVLLGRGGSDTSAAYFAAKLQAQQLEIWTDVPGMFSANPRATPQARLLRSLHYDEAQEVASSGAKVLHPRCILPAKSQGIPIVVYATQRPELPGTHISADGGDGTAQVKAVCIKKGITLVSLDSPGMWHEAGFLADAFQIFKRHGMSVDLVSTSETNVTVSLDPAANALDAVLVEGLVAELAGLCRTQIIGPCASVSLVGRNIRAILHRLGEAFELFADQRIYLVSQAANDLNFTFVVDEDQGDRLVEELHERLIQPVRGDAVLGPTWQQLFEPPAPSEALPAPWWRKRRAQLLELGEQHACAFVYDGSTIRAAVAALRTVKAVDRLLYAMKANPHAGVLRLLAEQGVGFDCVSRGEIEHLLASVPGLSREHVLFTPNFAAREEYAWALEQGITLTIDNLYVLSEWGALFRDRGVFIRIDTGTGRGHHHHVRTAGAHAKFGVPLEQADELLRLVERAGARVIGLHAHAGSGVFDVDNWSDVATRLLALAQRFPSLQVIDVGGGLGVPDGSGQAQVDLAELDTVLSAARQGAGRKRAGIQLWLEPGRYLVAVAGVLLARVTQLKSKDDVHYVGLTTGMNSLIRPALYGAWHEIVNLSRLDEPAVLTSNVVGPICESADFLGHDRLLPPTHAGDVMLIANAGAYGHAMSSRYNLREPAGEILLD